ncbi:aminotransferase class I/II-fold pyridoxal phosphate-dependent enzyme [Camelliibacillus cellulosilyticus]|uniref:Aminotransferase class I/II-fold pyridoxal phosphate-dependent enzyme n=1 Tax=Camelliibacillus cellulosilyticus TaxID=2174486 RepID=A0ABV9GJU4_9BACL
MFDQLKNRNALKKLSDDAMAQISEIFDRIERVAEANQWRVLNSFKHHRISDAHLNGTTGYGYDDFGREALEAVYADVFGTEAGLVRPQMVSGTHAITIALFGVLRPGDELLYVSGAPYDTLEEVIGLRPGGAGSLKEFGVSSRVIPLKDNQIDVDTVIQTVHEKTKMVAIQRSRGYSQRQSLAIADIEQAVRRIKSTHPHVLIFVDNCYGEFVEDREPGHVGVDLMAGSLIKNPGAGLVPSGGYIVGRSDLVDLAAQRLTAPGLGREVGPTYGALWAMYQGLFLAPHITSQALKGAVFTAAVLENIGFKTDPLWSDPRTDLVQSVTFDDADKMMAFCQAIQAMSPINSHVTPYPSPMPGYEDDVIMAAGTFVQGSSIELSADGPIRPPYTAFIQGGLVYAHVKIAILTAIDRLIEKGWVSLP